MGTLIFVWLFGTVVVGITSLMLLALNHEPKRPATEVDSVTGMSQAGLCRVFLFCWLWPLATVKIAAWIYATAKLPVSADD